MKIFICADFEGIGCVVRKEHTRPGQREYERARVWMTNEVNAAVEAAFENGASDVVVADSHNVGLNLLPDLMHPKTRLVIGGPRFLSMMEGIQEGFDGVMFIGLHAMAGTQDATIPHIFHGRIQAMRLNGVRVGEIGLNTALAAHYGAPIMLLTGDKAACAEAEALLPGLPTLAVKQGLGMYAAISHMPSHCCDLTRAAVEKVMQADSPRKTWKLDGEVLLELLFTTTSGADRALRVPRTKRIDPLTISYSGSDVVEAFQAFNTIADVVELIDFI